MLVFQKARSLFAHLQPALQVVLLEARQLDMRVLNGKIQLGGEVVEEVLAAPSEARLCAFLMKHRSKRVSEKKYLSGIVSLKCEVDVAIFM